MYICSSCGTAFDGRVCPVCCTMRPAAAVLGNSGRILRNRDASAVPPQEQAAHFAEELEHSRQADAWRREQQRHTEEMRRRAAELAQVAELAQQRKDNLSDLTEEEQRYVRQAQKAAKWQRKAPNVRSAQPEETDVELPEALRSLKIDSRNPDRPVPQVQSAERHAPDGDASRKTAVPPVPRDYARRPAYPGGPQVPQRREGGSAAPVRSDRIDAAWRSFASGEAASGQNVIPRLPSEGGRTPAAVPRPPAGSSDGSE